MLNKFAMALSEYSSVNARIAFSAPCPRGIQVRNPRPLLSIPPVVESDVLLRARDILSCCSPLGAVSPTVNLKMVALSF